MFVITNVNSNEIFMMGDKLDYMENDYPRLVNENVAFPTEMVNVYEVNEVPSNVVAVKYCYTSEDGFYKNPHYVEPVDRIIYSEAYQAGYDQAVLDLMGV